MLSAFEIEQIVDAVVAKLGAPQGQLLTKNELASLLKVSPATVTRSVRRGMPVEHVGDLPRFDAAACRAWLRAQTGSQGDVVAASGMGPGVRKIERRQRTRA